MDARGQVRAPTLLPPALTYVSPWALQCDLPLLPAPTPPLARVFSPTCVTRHAPGAGRRDLSLPSAQGPCCTPDPHAPNSSPGAGGDGKAPHGDPAFLPGFLLPGRDTALQEGFLPSCPPLSSVFFPFPQHFSLSEGEGVSGFWLLNTLCFADDVFPSGNCCVAPLPGAWGQPKGSRSSGWDLPPPGWGLSLQLQGRGAVPALSQRLRDPLWMSLLGQHLCSRPPQDLLLQGFAEPSCSPAAVLGSGRLMETFIPSGSSPSPGCLSRNASCSPHACSSSTLLIFSFCIPAWDCPRMGTCGLMPNPKRAGWAAVPRSLGRTSVSRGDCSGSPPSSQGTGLAWASGSLQQCLARRTRGAANYILQRSQNYWDSFTRKLGSGGCSVAVL